MKGKYVPYNDGWGIVGYHYICPKCKHTTRFTNCETGCESCSFSEGYIDPDDWFGYERGGEA